MAAPPSVTGYTSLTQQTRIVLENSAYAAGEVLLMAQTAGAATMSLTTQPNVPSPTTGMHLHVFIIGNTGTGTVVITGTKPDTTSVTSQTYHVNPAPQQSQGYSEFTTKEVFATVNASGIALTSLTPCTVMVFGSYAAKYLLPITVDPEEKITHHAPQDKRGILFKNFRVVQLTKGVDIAKFDSDLYPDSLWAWYMAISNTPGSITTVPGTPTTLLASTSIAATMTLSSAPAVPGEFLIFAITGNTATGTIVVGGTDPYGNAYGSSETITFTSAASQTVYSSRRYSVVNTGGAGTNKFTTTGGTGSSIAVTGVFAWVYPFTWDGLTNITPYSGCLEAFDGVMGIMLPGFILSELVLAWAKEKEIQLTSKGQAQDYCIVGDPNPTTYPSGTNPFSSLSQPTSLPVVSWPASFYIDADLGGTAFTTQDGSMLDYKLTIQTGRKWNYAGDSMQRASFVTWDTEPDFMIDATLIFQNYQYYVGYFKQNTPLILGTTFQGNFLGSAGSTVYYEQIQITTPCKIDTFKPDRSKNPVQGILKLMSQYDAQNLGYAYKVAITCQQPPVYTV